MIPNKNNNAIKEGQIWFGDIPDHWILKKIKFQLIRNTGGVWGDDFDDNGKIVLRSTEQNVDGGWNIIEPAKRDITLKEYEATKLLKGDLLITKSSGSSLHIGKTSIVDDKVEQMGCSYSNFMQRIRFDNRNNEPKFFFYLFNSFVGRQQFDYYSNTTTGLANLSSGIIGNVNFGLPPLPEQQTIAAFLDYKTEQIDKLIEKKEQLLKLLEEKRIALITQAVTKGIDTDVKMKPSGIAWLGDIPEHWVVKRLKRVSALFGRIGFRGYSTEDIVDEMEGAITLSPSNMVDGKLDLTKCTYLSWDKYNESPEIQIKDGDILLVKTGSTIGKIAFVHIVEYPMTINPQIAVFKKINCVKKYLYYYLISSVVLDQFRLSNTGSTIPTMTQETIGNYAIPLPLEAEQKLIVAYIEAETKKIEKLFDQITLAIIRLKEYRTSLITAAVTGKIDVRDFKPERV